MNFEIIGANTITSQDGYNSIPNNGIRRHSGNLNRTANRDEYVRSYHPKHKKKGVIDSLLAMFVQPQPSQQVNKVQQPMPFVNMAVRDFSHVKGAALLPKNQPVLVGKNAILTLAGVEELDFTSPFMSQIIDSMKNGQTYTIGRNGNIRTNEDSRLVSGIHAEISKQNNQLFVKDTSLNGTELSYNKLNTNELVRNVGNNGKPLDNNYIQTSKETQFHFNKAIDTGVYTQSFESYKNTMCTAHKIAYSGYTGNKFWYKKHDNYVKIEPYAIRNEDGLLKNNYEEYAHEVEKIAKRYGDPYRANNPQFTTVNLKGISKYALPSNSTSMHVYPASSSMDEYFNQMYETSKQAINLINNNAPQRMILEKIAEHYQYAANARPYQQINNSLFMNEVNTLLKKAGMKAIPHGMLDHAAQRLQPETFKKYFTDYYCANKLG